jgi:hypothetical protein
MSVEIVTEHKQVMDALNAVNIWRAKRKEYMEGVILLHGVS